MANVVVKDATMSGLVLKPRLLCHAQITHRCRKYPHSHDKWRLKAYVEFDVCEDSNYIR